MAVDALFIEEKTVWEYGLWTDGVGVSFVRIKIDGEYDPFYFLYVPSMVHTENANAVVAFMNTHRREFMPHLTPKSHIEILEEAIGEGAFAFPSDS